MKTLILIAMAAGTALPATVEGDFEQRVAVCIFDHAGIPLAAKSLALDVARRVFAGVGVQLDWAHRKADCDPARRPLIVKIQAFTPDSFLPRALAYAQPFEGTHITVFWNRVRVKPGAAAVLGHVIAHEIGHLLQGITRHSDSGVMKATWDLPDYGQMSTQVLEFTTTDIVLIRTGLAARVAGTGCSSVPAPGRCQVAVID